MLPFEDALPFETLPFEEEEHPKQSAFEKLGLREDLAKAQEAATGLGEAGLGLAGGMAGMVGAVPPTLLQRAAQISRGEPGDFEQQYASNINKIAGLVPQPKTEVGQNVTENINEVINRYLTPLAPMLHIPGGMVAAQPKAIPRIRNADIPVPKTTEVAPKLTPAQRAAAAMEAETKAKEVSVTGQMELPFEKTTEGLATPYEAGQMGVTEPVAPKLQRRQMELPMGEGELIPPGGPVIEKGREGTTVRYEPPGETFTERTPDVLTGDNQGQIFRGDVTTPEARLGLQEAERATAQELKKGTILEHPPGEPLPYLQAPELPFNARTREQGGAINMEILDPAYQKIKELPNKIRLWFQGDEFAPKVIALHPDGTEAGMLELSPTAWGREARPSDDLTAMWVDTEDAPGKGLAAEMYKFAAEQGNDIKASGVLTEHGQRMWERFEKAGLAQQGRIRKQGGGILFDWKNKEKVDKLKGIGGIRESLKNIMPTEMRAPEVIEMAKNVPDVNQNVVQKAINLFTKGGLYLSEKVNHPFVRFATEKILDADRLTRADVRDYIHDDLAPAMRDLDKKEFTDIAATMNAADLNQSNVTTRASLESLGFSEKQIALAEKHRKVMDYAFEMLNRARAFAGKGSIDKRVAYAAMQMSGDFRKHVFRVDEGGNKELIGVIGANTKWQLDALQKKLSDKGWVFDKESKYYGGGSRKETGSAQAAFLDILDKMAESNPHTKEFLDTINDLAAKNAYDFLNAKKHVLGKKGVFGMEGRKFWESEEKNAKDFMDSQLKYAETMIKWGHMSEAMSEIRQILASDVNAPQAKALVEQYAHSALGLNPFELGRDITRMLGTLGKVSGIGTTIPANTMKWSRKIVNTILLGLNPRFLATNIIQLPQTMPGMNAWLKAKGLDETSWISMGYDAVAQSGITAMKEKFGQKLDAVERDALEYAKKYHVYGSEMLDTSTLSRKNAEYYIDKAGNLLSAPIESSTRKMAFLSFVHLLDRTKQFTPTELYKTAHNLTDMAMANYSRVERPKVFNAVGPLGEAAANLSTFKFNEMSKLAMFARELSKNKDARPLLVALATSVAFAGIQGTVGFTTADWLYKQITKAMGSPDSLAQRVLDLSEKIPVAGNKYALSHGGFSFLGLDMTRSLGMSDVLPTTVGELAFPGGSKLVDIASAGKQLITDPSVLHAKQLAREAAVGGTAGPMDLTWFSKKTPQGDLAINRKTLEPDIYRNEADKRAKMLGFTGIHESVEKQKLYEAENIKRAYTDLRSGVLKKAKEQMFAKGKIDPDLQNKYRQYQGDDQVLEKDLISFVDRGTMSAVEAAKLKAMMSSSIPEQYHAERLEKLFPGGR